MGYVEDLEFVTNECVRLGARQRLALTALNATKVRSVSMAFLFDAGKGDSFYRVNDGLDAVWLDLRGIEPASIKELMRARDEAERWVTRLEEIEGEAAGFAADSVSATVSAISDFIEPHPEAATNSIILVAEISSAIASFLAEHRKLEGEYFLAGESAAESSLSETRSDLGFFQDFGAADFPVTRFKRRAGARNLRLGEQMKSVLEADSTRLA
ncbi:hypothetical protein JCM9957A_58030 [Kineosporia succinea]